MELYGDFAGETVARRLGVPAGDGLGDPVGRPVIASLLDPGTAKRRTQPSCPGQAMAGVPVRADGAPATPLRK
jgi:hypothetical protein